MIVVELAKKTGVDPEVIRYYTRIGLLKPYRNPINNYNHYNLVDVKCMQFICHARGLGFTLAEVGEVLEIHRLGGSPCHRVRKIIKCHIEENSRAVKNLTELQRKLDSVSALWEKMPDEVLDESLFCKLIKSIENA